MNSYHLILKYLGQNKLRTTFTVLSILIAFLLFGLLGALDRAFSGGIKQTGAENLITQNKISIINPLPLSYQHQIEKIDGVETVTHFTFLAAYYQDQKKSFFAAATEPDKLFDVYSDWSIQEQHKFQWVKNRTGAVIGQALAESYGFKIGDRLPIQSNIWGKGDAPAWEVTIDGIFNSSRDVSKEMAMYLHYEYFNESRRFGQGNVGWYVTKANEPELVEDIIQTMNAQLDLAKTSSEKNWALNVAQQFGNISLIVIYIMLAVFFTMILVVCTSMAQSLDERLNDLAVLRTMGFTNNKLFRLVFSESLLVSVVSGVLGLLCSILIVGLLRPYIIEFIPGFVMHTDVLLKGFALAVILGVIAGMLPAIQIIRLNVTDALMRGQL